MAKRPSILPPSKPGPRRRSGPGGLSKPIRVERVFALLAGVVLLVVPLYFWRKPKGIEGKEQQPVAANEASLVLDSKQAPPEPPSRARLGEVRIVRCGDGPRAKLPEDRCDRLPFFENALLEAIKKNDACAPSSGAEATVSFVLSIDFQQEKVHLWPGRSGSLRRPQANDLLRCVQRDITVPDWSAIAHRHRFYEISVLATYRD